MSRLQVEYRSVAALVPYAKNSRKHSEKQVAQLVASIREFGFCAPVLVDGDNGVIAGHGRVMAAKDAGLSEIPVIELGHLTPEQRRAYVIADNKLAQGSSWDDGILAEELRALRVEGFDLGLSGFDMAEIDKLLFVPPAAGSDEDETPAPQAEVITQPGDVWMLDAHRLMCGDSTDAASVATLLGGGGCLI